MRMILRIRFFGTLLFTLLFYTLPINAQSPFRVMCYNVENLFDTADDPCKEDNEFLPDGNRYWTRGRYYHKLRQIAKTISAAGEWDTPALVGLCEVENDSVLHELTRRSPLRAQEYRYLITQGSDPRGINVALLYQRDRFGYIGHEAIPIRFTRERHKQSRDILHVWGKIQTGDTLDVFVCHFPSRYGGEKESEQDRLDAARTPRGSLKAVTNTKAHGANSTKSSSVKRSSHPALPCVSSQKASGYLPRTSYSRTIRPGGDSALFALIMGSNTKAVSATICH